MAEPDRDHIETLRKLIEVNDALIRASRDLVNRLEDLQQSADDEDRSPHTASFSHS